MIKPKQQHIWMTMKSEYSSNLNNFRKFPPETAFCQTHSFSPTFRNTWRKWWDSSALFVSNSHVITSDGSQSERDERKGNKSNNQRTGLHSDVPEKPFVSATFPNSLRDNRTTRKREMKRQKLPPDPWTSKSTHRGH